MTRQTAYYDREAGIVHVTILPRRHRKRHSLIERSDERPWGLIGYDNSNEVVGFEFWRPLETLPADLLEAMPELEWTRWERLTWPVRDRWDRIRWRLWHRRRRTRWPESAEDGEPPQRWYRGLPTPPTDPAELEEYRRQHPDVKT